MTAVRFGTDGIRGIAGATLTTDIAHALGRALAARFLSGTILIGRDTRPSGVSLSDALATGLREGGATAIDLGVIPTPGLAAVVAADDAISCGVVVTASHNPVEYNGLKVIGRDGRKVPDAVERELEVAIGVALSATPSAPPSAPLEPQGVRSGAASSASAVSGAEYARRYALQLASVAESAAPNRAATGVHVVVDASNGAGAPYAKVALAATGAAVDTMATGEGTINDGVGATAPAALGRRVVELGANLGIALDGDADRCTVVDECGEHVDGDVVIGLIALDRMERGLAGSNRVVATILTNAGVERRLKAAGITLQRTPVGDRHIAEALSPGVAGFGGEKSGHLLFAEHSPTGDGLISAIEVIALLARARRPLSALAATLPLDPQVQRAIIVQGEDAAWLLAEPPMLGVIKEEAERLVARGGRLVVRASGTEPLLRVMGEGPEGALVEAAVERVLAEAALRIAERHEASSRL